MNALEPTPFRSGFIGFVGLPNAGKSSLINKIIGEKVGIVTSKPQTTRQRVVGIYSDQDAQLLCVDTPGIISSELGLHGFLKKEVHAVMSDVDALVAVLNVDAKSLESLLEVVELINSNAGDTSTADDTSITASTNTIVDTKPWCIVISKADLSQDHRVAALRNKLKEFNKKIVITSSTHWSEDLKETLLPTLKNLVPQSPPLYENDIYTTQNMRALSSEIIREKCFVFLHQEIPYGMAVQIKSFQELPEILNISAELIVSKEKHRPIVIGRGGSTLKRIGQSARLDIEKITGQKVFLELYVKVKVQWTKKKSLLRDLGYVINK